jgi:hypothetical protein
MSIARMNPFAFINRRREMPNPAGLDLGRLLAAAQTAPDLPMLEWDGDREAHHNRDLIDDPRAFPQRRRRIRDRYVAARFPGIARCAADLADAAFVIKAARLHFEDQQPELALELLGLAIEESPEQEALWLARLEILFLHRDREGYVATARGFRATHRASPQWSEVERLGRALAPGDALFGNTGWKPHEHYGPWPHLPNWIQASWDLTGEVMAADFHRALKQ